MLVVLRDFFVTITFMIEYTVIIDSRLEKRYNECSLPTKKRIYSDKSIQSFVNGKWKQRRKGTVVSTIDNWMKYQLAHNMHLIPNENT